MPLTNHLKHLLRRPLDQLEVKRLAAKAPGWHLPRHVGLILDGNRRFARECGLGSVVEGHARGADKLHEVLRWFYDLGIHVVTIWIFSTDNFKRDPDEVGQLLGLIEAKTRELTNSDDIHEHQIRVRYIGRTNLLPQSLQEAIDDAQQATCDYQQNFLNVAIAYGGREEITDAIRSYLEDHGGNGTTPADLAERFERETLDGYMYTAGMPDPDLIIRTSGEQRMSGFLLWQSAYAEYYFCDNYWPQFRQLDLLRALQAYHQRQRRYGK